MFFGSTVMQFDIIQTLDTSQWEALNLQVNVLRTDRLHPVISGNKWMKLQPWLKKAKDNGFKEIVTKGGPWSNHLHATAYACYQQKLGFTAVVKAVDGLKTSTLEDVIDWGGKIVYTNHALYKNENYWEQFSSERNALYIPMGGEGEHGIIGVSEFFNALQPVSYDYVICSIGTGTTLKGIANSSLDLKHLIAANPGINDSGYNNLQDELRVQFPTRTFEIWQQPALLKFGKWPTFLPEKMNGWVKNWDLPTDIVYTAKMFYQFEEQVNAGYFRSGSKILLVHTGGLQGNRSLPKGILNY
jgi:1-aminocyclopropane-1-carboxylate deaminase